MKMKRTGKAIAIVLASFLTAFISGCGGGGSASNSGTTSGTTKVTVSIDESKVMSSEAGRSSSAVPQSVATIVVTVSGSGMQTQQQTVNVSGQSDITITFDGNDAIPNGPNRDFFAVAKDSSGATLFQGDAKADLDGTPINVPINMNFVVEGEWTLTTTGQDGQAKIAFITVTQTGNSLTFSGTDPEGGNFTGSGTLNGSTVQLTVTGTDCGNAFNASVTGTLSADGRAINGNFTQTGGCGSDSGSVGGVRGHVSPAATLTSVAVTPTNPSISAGTTQQFTATGSYSDGSTQDITAQVVWSSSDASVATISNAGLATGVAAGNATITAASGSISGSATLTVTSSQNQGVVSGTVTLNSPTGPAIPGVTVTLSQQGTAKATTTTDSNGKYSITVAAGNYTISFAKPGFTTTPADITIVAGLTLITNATAVSTSPVLISISVTPTNPSIAVGATQQFTATGSYSDGSTQDMTAQVAWSSSNTSVATISNAGLATGVAAGTATITATSGGVSGTATLTVTNNGSIHVGW